MRGPTWPCVLVLAIVTTGSARAQELRGFLVLEGDPGYLTNAYLDPGFATWAPEVETAFGSVGGTGLLEWSSGRTTATGAATVRWIGFADSTPAWHAYLFKGGLERRLGDRVGLAADAAFSEFRRPAERRTLWGQAALRWTVSPRVRLSLGPGLASRRFPIAAAEEDDGGLLDPPVDIGGPPDPGPSGEADATSYLLLVGLEAWPGRRWLVRAEAFGARTSAPDLGLDYEGGGGSLRLTRRLGSRLSLSAGGAIEGFGYRAATEATDGSTAEVPADDLIWRGELGLGWAVGRRAELRARLAGLGRSGGGDEEGLDLYASAGVRIALGGVLAGPRRSPPLWTRTPEGMRVRFRYDGAGRVFVVGDFNAWAEPGVPLRPEGGGVHAATLELEPGSYRYRVRVVEGERERWLELPEGTPTVEDGFGGENGLLVVGEDASRMGRESEMSEVSR